LENDGKRDLLQGSGHPGLLIAFEGLANIF
jgi:hypothetical protein